MHCPSSSPSLAALEKHLLNKPASGGHALFLSAARNNDNAGRGKSKTKKTKTQQKTERERGKKPHHSSSSGCCCCLCCPAGAPSLQPARPGPLAPTCSHSSAGRSAGPGGQREAGGALGAALEPDGFTLNSRADPHHHLPVSGWGLCVGKTQGVLLTPKKPCSLARRASPLLSQQPDFLQGRWPTPAPCPSAGRRVTPTPTLPSCKEGCPPSQDPCSIFFSPQGGENPATQPLSKEAALLTCKADPLTPAPLGEGGCPGSTQYPWSMEGTPQHSVLSQWARPRTAPSPEPTSS